MNINTVKLQYNKEFIMFIFYFKMVQRTAFWVLWEALFSERLKTIGTAILTINKRNKIWWNITETTIFIQEDKYLSVSKNPESSSLKLEFLF